MPNSASNRATIGLLGIGAALAVGTLAARRQNRLDVQTQPPASTTTAKTSGQGGGGGVTVISGTTTVTPRPAPIPPKPTVTVAAVVPAGPSWAGEPGVNASVDLQRQAATLAKFLAAINPTAWGLSPIARQNFALDVCLVAKQEAFPLDVLVGHMWAESACTSSMKATPGSGAWGPLQVSRITCADVGAVYPPPTVQEAIRTGVKYLRKCRNYGAGSLNDALRMYGLGPGGFQDFMKYGCSGTPCTRPQTVWRHECGCSGQQNRYTWKVNAMAKRAATVGLHTRPWADWRAK